MQLQVSIKLRLETPTNLVHYAIIHADWHSTIVVPNELILSFSSLVLILHKELVKANTELADAFHARILYVCIVVLHQCRVYVSHKVWLLVRKNPDRKLSSLYIFFRWTLRQLIRVKIIPRTGHWLANNSLCLIYSILLVKLTTLDAVIEYVVLFTALRILRLNVEHRSDPVRCSANVIAEAGNIRSNQIIFNYINFLAFSLHTEYRWRMANVLHKNSVVRQKDEVAVLVCSI